MATLTELPPRSRALSVMPSALLIMPAEMVSLGSRL